MVAVEEVTTVWDASSVEYAGLCSYTRYALMVGLAETSWRVKSCGTIAIVEAILYYSPSIYDSVVIHDLTHKANLFSCS